MKWISISLTTLFMVFFLCLSFTLAAQKEVGQDGTFIAYDNGVVYDTATKLEWVVGPDEDTNWKEAKSWAQELNLEGGGWRMPTLGELEGLYKEGAGSLNMTPLLKTTGTQVWSGETKDLSYAWGFSFISGEKFWCNRINRLNRRAFAVRSRTG